MKTIFSIISEFFSQHYYKMTATHLIFHTHSCCHIYEWRTSYTTDFIFGLDFVVVTITSFIFVLSFHIATIFSFLLYLQMFLFITVFIYVFFLFFLEILSIRVNCTSVLTVPLLNDKLNWMCRCKPARKKYGGLCLVALSNVLIPLWDLYKMQSNCKRFWYLYT